MRIPLIAALLALGLPAAAQSDAAVTGAAVTGATLWSALQPIASEAASLAIAAVLGWLTLLVQRATGVQIESRHREALHRALLTGVNQAIARQAEPLRDARLELGSPQLATLVNDAIAYARTSVPDAIRKFGLEQNEALFRQLAEAKLLETRLPVTAPASLRLAAE